MPITRPRCGLSCGRFTSVAEQNMLRFAALDHNDIEPCLALSRNSDPHPWRDDTWRRSLRDEFCFGLFDDRCLLAVAAFSLVMDEASLLNIVVGQDLRGKGLGRHLLSEGLNWMQQIGAQRCLLEVRRGNASARALYQRLGFVEDGIRKNYYPLGDGREDAVLMSADLPLTTE